MTAEASTLLTCCDGLTTALATKDICWLNDHLAPTAERRTPQVPPQAKYDWIDAIQNEGLIYDHFTAPTLDQLVGNWGQAHLTARLTEYPHRETPVTLQLTFIREPDCWQLYRDWELSEKPIDWIG